MTTLRHFCAEADARRIVERARYHETRGGR